MSFYNHYNSTAQSRNPLTMVGMESNSKRPNTPDIRPRSAQATPNLLTWTKPAKTPQQARVANRDKITQSSHNLLSHQEFKAENTKSSENNQNRGLARTKQLSRSDSNIINPSEQFVNPMGKGEKRGKSPVKKTHYKSFSNDAEQRNVTSWGVDKVGYSSKYNKLEDNSVSKRNSEEHKRRNVLHLTEENKQKTKGTKNSNDLYKKNFTSSEGLIGGTGEGTTQNLKTMTALNKDVEKLTIRRRNEMNSSVLCRKEGDKPKWR